MGMLPSLLSSFRKFLFWFYQFGPGAHKSPDPKFLADQNYDRIVFGEDRIIVRKPRST